MSRRSNFEWTEDKLNQLRRGVRRFGGKVRRLEKQVEKLDLDEQRKIVLPERIKLNEMKNLIKTEKDFKREMAAIERFMKKTTRKGAKTKPQDFVDVPDNEHGLKMTRWQRTEMNRDAAKITKARKKREKEITQMEQTSQGQGLGYNVQMGQAEQLSLRPRTAFTRSMGRREINARAKALRKERQTTYYSDADARCKENYIKAIEQNYGHMPGCEDLIKQIKRMHRDTFFKRFKTEPANFEIASPPRGAVINIDAYYEGLLSTWMPNRRKGA